MPTSSVSKALQALLEAQRKENAVAKARHDQDAARLQQQWRKRELWQRQDQQNQKQQLRAMNTLDRGNLQTRHRHEAGILQTAVSTAWSSHNRNWQQRRAATAQRQHEENVLLAEHQRQSRQALTPGLRVGDNAQLLVRRLQNAQPGSYGWSDLSKHEQHTLEGLSRRGAGGEETARHFRRAQKHEALQQHDRQRHERVGESQQQKAGAAKITAAVEKLEKGQESRHKSEASRQADQHKKDAHKQGQQHQDERLQERHKYETLERAVRTRHRDQRETQGGRHQQERTETRDKHERIEEQTQKAAAHRQHVRGALGQVGKSALAGNVGGMAAGMGKLALGGPVAMAAQASFMALDQGAQKAAATLNVLNSSYMTSAQQVNALAKEWVPGYESFKKFMDACDHVSDKMYQLGQRTAHQGIRIAGEYEKSATTQRLSAELGHHQHLAKAMRGAQVPDISGIDRSTWQGEIAYREASTRLPHQAAISRAEAQAKAAGMDYNASASRVVDLQAKKLQLDRELDKARRAERGVTSDATFEENKKARDFVSGKLPGRHDLAKDGSVKKKDDVKKDLEAGRAGTYDEGREKVHRTAAATVSAGIQERALNNQKQLMEEINRQKELGLALAQKESDVRKAQNNLLKANIALLKQKESRMSGTATNLALMPAWKRGMAMQNLKTVMKAKDIGALPQFMVQQAMGMAPDMVRKQAEQQGMKLKEFKELQKMGAVDKGDLNQVRKDIAKGEAQVQVNVNVDTEKLASAMAHKMLEVFGKGFENILKEIDQKFKILHEKQRTGQTIANAHK